MMDCRGTITVRPAKASDQAAILRLFVSSIRELARGCYSSDQIAVWSGGLTMDRIDAAVESGKAYVAEIGGEIAGFGQVDLAAGLVEMLYVSPTYARRGVGTKILRFIEDLAARNGLESLRLRASVNAVPFYLSVGYVEVEKIIHRADDGTEFECVNMKRDLL